MSAKKPKGEGRELDLARLEKRRMKAARLFARGLSQAEVARRLKVSRQAAKMWFDRWREGGRAALKAPGRVGRKPKLTPDELHHLEKALLRGPRENGFDSSRWNLYLIARLIERLTGVRYHPGHVWRIMRSLQSGLSQGPAGEREGEESGRP